MPKRLKKPCNYPFCSELVPDGQRFCDKHKTARRVEDRKYKARRTDVAEQAFYKTERWRRLRAWKLQQNPLCEMCKAEGRTTPAVLVHHKLAIKDGGELMSVENLMSLCQACHNRLHRG